MGRLTRAAKIQQTKSANKASYGTNTAHLKPFKHEDELEFITPAKQAMLDHPAKKKSWIGAKETGKNRSINTRATRLLQEQPNGHMLGMRKYKQSVKSRVANAIRNMALEIRSKGFNALPVEHSQGYSYFVKDKYNRQNNQTLEYAGFDDINGIAGIEAPNLGKFILIEIDEPVLAKDPGKVPSPEDWANSIKMMEDSVNRSNRRYAQIHNEEVSMPEWHYAMNPWDDHPEVLEAEKYFPEEDFLAWVLQDPKNNCIKGVYNKELDKLYIRLTKFANPTLDHDKLLVEVNTALKENNKFELTRLLGLKNETVSDDPRVWNMAFWKTSDTYAELKKRTVLGYSIGWDIDVNRQLTMTISAVAGIDNVNDDCYEDIKIFMLPQEVIKAYGSSPDKTKRYVQQMEERSLSAMKMMQEEFLLNLELGTYCYFDQDQHQWSWGMEDLAQVIAIGKAKKHGVWDILRRQQFWQIAGDAERLEIDKENKKLLKHMERATRKEGSPKRDESGSKEKEYDEINSGEYSLYPWRGIPAQYPHKEATYAK